MFKLMGKKIIAILRKLFLLNWPYVKINLFSEVFIPTGDTKMKVHEVPRCAQDIGYTMNNCFSSHGLEPDMFLVNITHDRSNFIGDKEKARSLCK